MSVSAYIEEADILRKAHSMVGRALREEISPEELARIEKEIASYENRRKGQFGELVERHVFGIIPNSRPEPDFAQAGIELKTNPLKKHPVKTYVSKERLVFSMIDYKTVGSETWEGSSFLKKNKRLLIMFYLWIKEQNVLDYEFKFAHFLDLLADMSAADLLQIKADWEFIVGKIRRNEAHLLSEGDTYYLGACTKASNGSKVRDQAGGNLGAKPRAFSFKQQYLNFIIQKHLLKRDVSTDSIFKKERRVATIEQAMQQLFSPFIGKTDAQIVKLIGWTTPAKQPKNYKRLLVDKMLGLDSGHIEELEKANVTLRVVTLEHTGTLKESISFPAFDYKELSDEPWYDAGEEIMSDFHAQLETKRFLFVIFQKQKGSDDIVLRGIRFWNFPMQDIGEAERVFEKTKECIREGRYADLPKISENRVAHVRPHGQDCSDTIETPQGTQEVKRCFWLNAKYIQGFLR